MAGGIGGFLNSLGTAINGNNLTAAATAYEGLQGALGTSTAMTSKATQFINNFNMAEIANDQAGMQNAINGLDQMSDQLPPAAQPYLAQLNSPLARANPTLAGQAIMGISTALAHHNFF